MNIDSSGGHCLVKHYMLDTNDIILTIAMLLLLWNTYQVILLTRLLVIYLEKCQDLLTL